MWPRSSFLVLALGPILTVRLVAQDPAQVEALAPLLMAEDRRDFNAAVLSQGLNDPDPIVRRIAATSVGRIGDRHGTRLLVPLLADPDASVVTAAFFALGLVRDSTAVDAIVGRLRTQDSLTTEAVGEAATALERIGGATAAHYVEAALAGTADLRPARRLAFIPAALQDAWRLGALMPAAAILRFAGDTAVDRRVPAIYSLGRRGIPAAGRALLNALRDPTPAVREVAAQWLTRQYSDTAGLAPAAVENELIRALDDEMASVRINAVRALVTFRDSASSKRIAPLLSDADQNVRVSAALALGDVPGTLAANALNAMMDRKDAPWAVRLAGLMALARADTVSFVRRAAIWLASADPRERIAALQATGTLRSVNPAVFRQALVDPDVRVQAAALAAWSAAARDSELGAAARIRLRSGDPGVRAAAAAALTPVAGIEDLDLLIAAWRQSAADRESIARLAVFGALRALAVREPGVMAKFDDPSRRALFERPDDPVVRAEAFRTWPEVARRWGDQWPISTDRTIDDYRSAVRLYLLAQVDPHVTIEVEGRGSIDIELLGHEAPLTVANFLRLVDQHFFDGNRLFRVVPNGYVQAGDKSGTGNGGPGWTIRDEINQERFSLPMLGMALSGPDTGGSQWFINLTALPDRDGAYTVFGRVTGSYNGLARVAQGDVIRSIHR